MVILKERMKSKYKKYVVLHALFDTLVDETQSTFNPDLNQFQNPLKPLKGSP